MKKIIPIFLVGMLVLSGLGAVANSENETIKESKINKNLHSATISFSAEPIICEKEEFLAVSFADTDKELTIPGKPVLPIHVQSFQLPAKASNIQVRCTIQEFETIDLSKEIIPGPKYISRNNSKKYIDASLEKNEQTYMTSEWYPHDVFNYKVTCGRNLDDIIVNFVDIQIHPIQYSPGNNKLQYIRGTIDIEITYETPKKTSTQVDDSYDLVIIAPDRFSKVLNRLVNHKNRFGMNTILKTTEEIYDEYDGRDKPEQIKYFIKDAIEQWDITYVLLVGGLKSYIDANDREDRNQGSTDWWIPVRYTNIYLYNQITEEEPEEPGCPSDLYYADIYKAGQVFDDWDGNENDIFAEADADLYGYSDLIDVLDLRPDVYVGRLACRNIFEVRIMMNKIINYEKKNNANKAWFDRMITIAGKTFGFYGGMPDGEYVCEKSLEYMDDLVDPVRIYVSNNDTGGPRPTTKEIIKEIISGAGFVSFQGHGNPLRWDTIWADGSYPYDWAGGLLVFDIPKMFNLRKLPVIVVGGCHNGLFNVTIEKTKINESINPYYWTHGSPTPVCFGWGLCMLPYGGAIATIAGTGLGIGSSGNPLTLSALLETNFFYQIGQNNAETFGQAHSNAIGKYITDHPILDATEYHCITIYQPFGDPSLMIGGYP